MPLGEYFTGSSNSRPSVSSRELVFPHHTHCRDLFTKAGVRLYSQAQGKECCWPKCF